MRALLAFLLTCCAGLSAHAQTLVSPPIAQVFDGGVVSAIAVQPDGKVIIGGQFTHVGGVARSNVARLNADGSLDAAWNPASNGSVFALGLDGSGNVYVGGAFTVIGGQGRNNIARLSTSGAGAADAAWNPNANNSVFALAIDGSGSVFAGGDFNVIGGLGRAFIAKLSASGAGTPDATWNPNASTSVRAIAFDGGGNVYAAGYFSSIGGQARSYIAKLAAGGAGAADATWNPGPGGGTFGTGGVTALALDGGNLYVGGDFSTIGGQSRRGIAKVSTSGAGSADATWNPNASGGYLSAVNALALDGGGNVYAGGDFAGIGGQSRSGIARLSTAGTGAADAAWDPNANGAVLALAVGGTGVYAGGGFQLLGGQAKGGLAALSASTAAAAASWPVLVSPNPGRVAAIARDASGRTVIGGRFLAMGDAATARANIARFNPDGSLDTVWNPGTDGWVNSLAVDGGGDVYAGGIFTRIGNQSRSNIAKLSGSGPGAADATWNPGANSTAPYGGVVALVLDGSGGLYAGGYFTTIGGQGRSSIAKLSASGAGTVDPTWNPSTSGNVHALALEGASNLYVGGLFSAIGGQPRNNIARLSTAGAGAADGTWNPNASGAVWALALGGGGNLFAAGGFNGIGGLLVRLYLAKVSTSGTGAADASWNPFPNSPPYALALDGAGNVHVGGDFTTIGGLNRNRIARLSATGTGAADAAWDANAGGTVSVLAADGGGVYVGGSFASIGGQPRAGFAVFAPPMVPGAPIIGTATGGNTQATVTFTAPASNGGSLITGYALTCNPGAVTQSGTASPIVVTGLANGTAYTCTVAATNAIGTGPASSVSNSVTPAPTTPGAPTIGMATAGIAQATVTFAAPASSGGSAITGYTATSSPGGITASGASSPLVVAGLANGTAYTFTVTAANAIGTGPASAPTNSVTPMGPTVPGAPTITLASPGNAQAMLHFAAPVDDGRSPITGYGATCNPGSVAGSAASSPITVTGLANETTYTCTVTATNAVGTGPASPAATVKPTSNPAPQLTLSRTTVDFGGQSMGTTSPAQTVTVGNPGAGTLVVSNVSVTGSQFAQTNTCTSVPPGGSCAIQVTFSPSSAAGALNSRVPASGTLNIAGNISASAALAGTGEKSLVTHYYRSILRRAPDPGGLAYWEGEAARMVPLGVNVNETWFSMAQAFYFSPEYLSFNRDTTEFVRDLYNTFFNRPPDDGGLNFWVSEIGSGMPREVALVSFMFSTEFVNFAQAIFGNTAARAEIDAVIDFYRGLLARLPDNSGFNYWVQRFRAAQCVGPAAIAVEVDAISSAFANSQEYLGRSRTDAQYVGDLYNAFLRRGGDLGGVQFWIGQASTQAQGRARVRQLFVASAEFSARAQAIVNQGCLP